MIQTQPPICLLEDRGLVGVRGEGAEDFLQRLVTSNVHEVTPAHAGYSALLTPQGKILFDFFIIRTQDGYLLDCERARVEQLIKRLALYKLRAPIHFTDESAAYAVYATWDTGPSLLGLPFAAGTQTMLTSVPNAIAFVDPRLAIMGARILLPTESDGAFLSAFRSVERGFYTNLRLLHGVPAAYDDFIPEEDFPLEFNFEELNAIDFQKGCYIGQEVTSRTKRRGVVRKRLMPVLVGDPLPVSGSPIKAGEQLVGEIRSVSGQHALALLRLDKISEAFASKTPLVSHSSRVVPIKPEWAAFEFEDWQLND